MRQGTYRLASGELLHCRSDQSGATRLEVELPDGRRREVDRVPTPVGTFLSDDPTWLVDDEWVRTARS